MLEIPESLTLAKQLNETVMGKKIVEAEAAHTPHSFAWYAGAPARYSEIMEGCIIGESRWKQVYQAVTETLAKMTAAGGRDTEKNLFGEKGGYPSMLSKKTFGKGCPYCGNIIQKASYMGGTVYFCPGCQEV